tara:strand:- start:602 stop:853 length:252 start_codon:yes stop_codon:yes gene_type:complete
MSKLTTYLHNCLHYKTTYTFTDGTYTETIPLSELDMNLQMIAKTGYGFTSGKKRWVLRVDCEPMWRDKVPITYENDRPIPDNI